MVYYRCEWYLKILFLTVYLVAPRIHVEKNMNCKDNILSTVFEELFFFL